MADTGRVRTKARRYEALEADPKPEEKALVGFREGTACGEEARDRASRDPPLLIPADEEEHEDSLDRRCGPVERIRVERRIRLDGAPADDRGSDAAPGKG